MPKQYRLNRAQFQLLQSAKPRRFNGVYFSLAFYTGREPVQGPKIGIIIAKKTISRANARNKVERQTREVSRSFLKNRKNTGIFVISAKKGAAEASFEELSRDLTSLFEQTH